MEHWYAFRAYSTQPRYGFGTLAEAEAYADILNTGREFNHFAPHALTPGEVADLRLEDGDLGFILSIALSDSEV